MSDENDLGASGESEFKQCPDCAEMVRAQARKCRFCGYRFDRRSGRERDQGAAAPTDVAELLEDWDLGLEREERVEMFVYARARGARGSRSFAADGFLLVTGLRLVLISTPRRLLPLRGQPRPVVLFERRLADLGEAQIVRGWHRSSLRIGEELTLSAIPKATLERLRLHIAEHRLAAG